jgi:tripartite ATP-independent transporter DctP family solute receptor
MKMLVRLFSVMVAAMLLGGLLTPWMVSAKEGEFVIKLAYIVNPTDPRHKGAEYFAKVVGDKSQNRVKVNLFPSGQLGPEREIIKGLESGAIEMTTLATAMLANFVPEFAVFDLPYLVSKPEDITRVIDGKIGAELLQKLAPRGIIGLAYWEASFRHLYTKKPVASLADLKGMKIRVPGNPVYTAALKAMGANPTPMTVGEVYTALQQGTVDGAENVLSYIYASKHYEIVKNIAMTYHAVLPVTLMISERYYKTLPPDIQKIIVDGSKEAGLFERKLEADSGLQDLEKMKAAGVKVTTPDLGPFISATKKIYGEFEDKLGKDLINRILDATKK